MKARSKVKENNSNISSGVGTKVVVAGFDPALTNWSPPTHFASTASTMTTAVIPAKAGIQIGTSSIQIIVKITPIGISTLDQFQLPSTAPFLDLFLAQDGLRHCVVKFDVDEAVDFVSLGKAIHDIGSVFRYATGEIAGHSDIQSTISIAGQDVNAGLHRSIEDWIPACAGMTG